MAYLFFVDESGIDHVDSPYEILCGAAVEDKDVWNVVSALKNLEEKYLGTRYSSQTREIKGRKFLKKKVFKQASLAPEITSEERAVLAKKALQDGAHSTPREIAALAQAKLEYVKGLFEVCSNFRIKIFASVCSEPVRETDDGADGLLRRDYVYLFERFYYYLEDKEKNDQGIVVFDELEKSQSHILVSELENYFKKTIKGRQRASLIIPEPFFVHSDLTTGIQIADLAAYIISWGLRLKGMEKPKRDELDEFVDRIKPLRYKTTREIGAFPKMEIWSLFYVK